MSNDNTTPEEDVSALRKAADDGKAARREAELAKREVAFIKAGINTDSKAGQAMLASYDGDLSPEALKAEAAEWGLGGSTPEAPPAQPEPQSIITADERALQQMRDANTAPEVASLETKQVDAYTAIFKQFEKDREDGFSQTEATNRAIGGLVKKAAEGDPTAIFDQDAWSERAAKIGHGAQYAR